MKSIWSVLMIINDKEKERLDKMMIYEQECYIKSGNFIAGIDEAGRGPLCGPVVAAAVILKKGEYIPGVNDSKKLSEKKRNSLYNEITTKAVCWSVGIVDEKKIDEINILEATRIAMKQAVEGLEIVPNHVLVDAEPKVPITIPYTSIKKGDSLSVSIAAASIIAKVTRDNIMYNFDKKYPEYDFSKNKGYGTKTHIEAIKKHGLCKIHRESFCKKFVM